MYLKSIELNGFKSFANKTALNFIPGLMAIVGPNGCGKSNVCEAIRWVLGEKSAKAMRGTKMEDVIFNGTDERKPLGMAEVSMTFGDCEKTLNTEFNEITITRRVFRSGENHYFINKTLCRLKDIQRLFMDTGIGTVSYSLLEQGHIDRILSSRPEDRREIFEEASGINKFKTDRAEAIRKLEHTEANLLRLDDVIREVKRQIGSLQRQAGKARRYKELRDELRVLDLFLTQTTLKQMDADLAELAGQRTHVETEFTRLQEEIHGLESASTEIQGVLARLDQEIATAIEAGAVCKSRVERMQDMIQTNAQRILEYESIIERDTKDIERAKAIAAQQSAAADEMLRQIGQSRTERDQSHATLTERQEAMSRHEQQMQSLREQRQHLRERLVEIESVSSRLQNERMRIESQEGVIAIRRERLAAEQGQLTRLAEEYAQRETGMRSEREALRARIQEMDHQMKSLAEEKRRAAGLVAEARKTLTDLQSRYTARQAQLELLRESDKTEDFPGGTRLLLDPANPLGAAPTQLLGSLADLIGVPQEYQRAIEVTLRAWLDAVVVDSPEHATQLLRLIVARREGSTRMLSASGAIAGDIPAVALTALPQDLPGRALLEVITCPDSVRPLVERLFHGVRIVASLDALPSPLPRGVTFVTGEGALVSGDGTCEFWMPETGHFNPMTRKHTVAEMEASLARIGGEVDSIARKVAELADAETALDDRLAEIRSAIDAEQIAMAMKDGEFKLLSKEAAQTSERLETVRWELREIAEKDQSERDRKQEITRKAEEATQALESIKHEIEQRNNDLHHMEESRSGLYAEVTEHRVRFSELKQRVEHFEAQHAGILARLKELTAQIADQSEGLSSYRASIAEFKRGSETARESLPGLESTMAASAAELHRLRDLRAEDATKGVELEESLSRKRSLLDDAREKRSDLSIKATESGMRRQNLLERAGADYSITPEDIMRHPVPEWPPEGMPSRDSLETQVAEIRAKLEAMGPVNLVAIEEYQEHEERYQFLTQQQEDLVKAKQQLLDMIKKINETTSELFTKTFEQVNLNFQAIFGKLFEGGTAKLVLTDEQDVLECGVEVIARPPGKRLQSVSLMSGGERTMTAVALLFALYMTKPSPFCVLDELDAALDESNIRRFIEVLQGFLQQSQFIVVTHNQRTIAAADVLYGVTMVKNTGISRIVSMRFNDGKAPENPTAENSNAMVAAR